MRSSNRTYNPYPFKILAFVLFAFIFSKPSLAQEFSKIGIELSSYLKEHAPDEMVPLLVEANNNQLHDIVKKYEGHIRLQVTNLYSLEIPTKQVIPFSLEESVELIEFNTLPGRPLSDTMLVNTNMDSVIQAVAPLSKSYTGKGVLLGVIDSGIEINHNDFKDSSGNSRILFIWDQGVAYNPNRKPGTYNYGLEWDSTDINAGACTHDDKAVEFGHGSMVTGAAASNGTASGTYRGVAPEVNIIAVATDFNKPNWLQTVAEAVDYIFKKADTLGMACVINASVGTYKGSHDGKDIAARMIDLLIKQKNGRSFVCAAGNAGHLKFHLRQEPQNDTVFTWLESHPALFSGFGGVYFEAWSDTNDFNQMQFAIGADRAIGTNFEFRGRSNFIDISTKVNLVTRDSVIGFSGNKLAYFDYYVEESQGRYKLEVAIIAPDSSSYLYKLETAGTGKLDVWSSYSLLRSSDLKTSGLPSITQYPRMAKYAYPDSLQTMVSSFTCLPSVITVGNYINRNTYLDFNGNLQNMGATPGQISDFSSLGPNRNGYLKPDISSAGDFMLSSGRIATLTQLQQIEPEKISQDGMHMRNGGTSMASPTVAGMVALYFEMCKTASYNEVKTKLIANAKTDAFTLSIPNPKWGAGKADAFRFLSSAAFTPNLNYGSTNFCNVDSIILSPLNLYPSYYWNTGDSTSNLTIDSNGTYFALVTNTSGCEAKSNEVTFNFYANPSKPTISQQNDTLSIASQGLYQWYRNNTIINGANLRRHVTRLAGNYYCELTDSSTNCFINSDTIHLSITDIAEFTQSQLSIFPNPASEKITIFGLKEPQRCAISIWSTSGRRVFYKELFSPDKSITIQLNKLAKGYYYLKVESEDSSIFKSLIIQ